MAEQKIEFRKTRDFGENLNDTFAFIWLNFKPLFKSFFAICAIFMLTQAILEGLYGPDYSAFWDLIYSRKNYRSGFRNHFLDFQYYLVRVLKWLTFVSLQVSLGAYIKYYVENNGEKPGIEEVWSIFRKYFFKILLLGLPVTIMVVLGLVLCIVPGIYLSVVFTPFAIIAMIENTSTANTYSRCFDLIQNNFWLSFLIYFVVIIIYLISSLLTGFVISGIMEFINYFTTYNLTTTIGILTSFFKIFSYCFYIIVPVSVALQYYSLAEKKEGTGIIDRINKIGNYKNAAENAGDEY